MMFTLYILNNNHEVFAAFLSEAHTLLVKFLLYASNRNQFCQLHKELIIRMWGYYILHMGNDEAEHQERTGTMKWKDSGTRGPSCQQQVDRQKTH